MCLDLQYVKPHFAVTEPYVWGILYAWLIYRHIAHRKTGFCNVYI